MHILLINPWIYDFTAYDFWSKPLGLLYIASLLQKYTEFDLSYIDCLDRYHPLLTKRLPTKPDGRGPFFKQEVAKPAVVKDIPRKYSRYGLPVSLFEYELSQLPVPDVVLTGCTMTYWYPGVQHVIEIIRKKWGQVPVILGGVYATLMPQHARRFSGADYIVEGYGEKEILPLLREILGDKACPSFRFEGLDDLPPPAFDLLRDRATIPLLTSRGCPFNCSFCAVHLLTGVFEQKKPSSVAKEIEDNYLKYHIQNIAFYDDALLLNKKTHILPILKEVANKNISVAFHTPNGLHIREIDLELARLLKKANFKSLFLSQESFDEAILQESSAKLSAGDLERALKNLERAGFKRSEINVYLIAGLPGQEATSLRESIIRIQKLGAKPRLAFFSPVPGTKKWEEIVENGYLSQEADPLLHNKLLFPYLWGNISPEDLNEIKQLLNRTVKSKPQNVKGKKSKG